ncbi:WAS/WASL-interacting protein family member 3-like [Grammomys surdaster]|uniref:WAS/WASL-interacting protein family member 3-like n=1 Tax=Grammomys surdaster TaxID=491861 RepID=UPI0010A004D1|nr:WAS/WASL-interacting protein family member 3-like [Grammomys surdaster]
MHRLYGSRGFSLSRERGRKSRLRLRPRRTPKARRRPRRAPQACSSQQVGSGRRRTAGRQAHARPRAGRAAQAAARCGLRRRRPFPSRRLPCRLLQGARPSYLTMDAARCHEPKPGPRSPKVGLPTPQSTQLPPPPPPAPPPPPLRDYTAQAPGVPVAQRSRDAHTLGPAPCGLGPPTWLRGSWFPKPGRRQLC